MYHRRGKAKLGVRKKHRIALLRNLVRSLVLHKRIRTTVHKAKAASSFADKMVSLAKQGNLHARRTLISRLGCSETADTLIEKIAPHFKNRTGGYTRVLRLGFRPGDTADVAILEFTERVEAEKPEKKAKKAKKEKLQEPHVHEAPDTPKKAKKGKKDSEETQAQEKEKKSLAADKDKEPENKKEAEKKGGFLGALRQFLKGDQQK